MIAVDNPKVGLGWRAIIPGLFFILVVDLLALFGLWPTSANLDLIISLIMLVLPWVTLIILRRSTQVLGYHRGQALRAFGWGVVAGGVWRIGSILLNLSGLNLGSGAASWFGVLIGGILWVPLVEETFYRGYLGRGLVQSIGLWPGIVVQAILFTLHPVHIRQGPLALISVFVFGSLAGWLDHRFDSLWSAWGAHAFANVLPYLAMIG